MKNNNKMKSNSKKYVLIKNLTNAFLIVLTHIMMLVQMIKNVDLYIQNQIHVMVLIKTVFLTTMLIVK